MGTTLRSFTRVDRLLASPSGFFSIFTHSQDRGFLIFDFAHFRLTLNYFLMASERAFAAWFEIAMWYSFVIVLNPVLSRCSVASDLRSFIKEAWIFLIKISAFPLVPWNPAFVSNSSSPSHGSSSSRFRCHSLAVFSVLFLRHFDCPFWSFRCDRYARSHYSWSWWTRTYLAGE